MPPRGAFELCLLLVEKLQIVHQSFSVNSFWVPSWDMYHFQLYNDSTSCSYSIHLFVLVSYGLHDTYFCLISMSSMQYKLISGCVVTPVLAWSTNLSVTGWRLQTGVSRAHATCLIRLLHWFCLVYESNDFSITYLCDCFAIEENCLPHIQVP